MTAIRKLWRKCLPLCASHLFINQPAIGLSSGWGSCFSKQWHRLHIICTNSPSLTVFHFLSLLLVVTPVFSVSVLIHLCCSHWALFQCCKRKLVAMLMSLFVALRASRASVLEKPISTNSATWGTKRRKKKTSAKTEAVDKSSLGTIFLQGCPAQTKL